MKIICKPRRAGKTFEAIELANKTDSYLVVLNKTEAQRVARLAKELNIQIRFPVSFEELISSRLRRSFVRSIVIDNADALLHRFFSDLKIEAITLTCEGEK